ncbi:MAG: glutathione S-transferase family protein [Parasphingorhabdus sp.]|uniref:glutathione S-transferase family protein n=1 Tax=Parasphingorhabdus sp. TaxID=2709688 RepID=UPI0030017129
MAATDEIRLIGYPVSNYFNIVRAALIEKAVQYALDICPASQTEEFLAKNPMGKIPVLASGDVYIAETIAILEYLDDAYPETSLRPDNLATRALMRQINNVVQVYLELPARALYPGLFMGQSNSDQQTAVFTQSLDRAIIALGRLLKPAPFLLGDALSQADLFAYYNLGMAERVANAALGRSIIDELALKSWWSDMAQRSSTQTVMGDFETYLATYLKEKKSDYILVPHFSEN